MPLARCAACATTSVGSGLAVSESLAASAVDVVAALGAGGDAPTVRDAYHPAAAASAREAVEARSKRTFIGFVPAGVVVRRRFPDPADVAWRPRWLPPLAEWRRVR